MSREDPRALELIRHDAAHVMAEAVQSLWPGTQVTIGPVIENGFYYDFAYKRPFTPEDLERIEARMREIMAEAHNETVMRRDPTAHAEVVAIRDATVNRLIGRVEEPQSDNSWDREQLVVAATSLLGGLAIVLAFFGFVRKEPRRPCIGAAVLGLGAVAFPFVIGAFGTVIVLIALGAIVSLFLG